MLLQKSITPGVYSYHQGKREQREIGDGFQNRCYEGTEAEEQILSFGGSGDVLGVFQSPL